MASEWIRQAIEAKVYEPTAMLVATATPEGRPSLRTVLLKEIEDGCFIFYTGYESRKGKQIAANPHVAVSFLWHEFERQIHIEGMIEKLQRYLLRHAPLQEPYRRPSIPPESAHSLPRVYHDALRSGESTLRRAYGTSPRELGRLCSAS